MIFLDDQADKKDNKVEIFKEIIKTNIEERDKRNIKYRNILIFFDDKNEKNFFDDIMDIIKKFYDEQIFIIIFSSGNIEDLFLFCFGFICIWFSISFATFSALL